MCDKKSVPCLKELMSYKSGSHSKNYLDLIFVEPLCEKVIFASVENYITPAVRKFMLDMSSPGSFQNIGL